jgi:hypothetical protein
LLGGDDLHDLSKATSKGRYRKAAATVQNAWFRFFHPPTCHHRELKRQLLLDRDTAIEQQFQGSFIRFFDS